MNVYLVEPKSKYSGGLLIAAPDLESAFEVLESLFDADLFHRPVKFPTLQTRVEHACVLVNVLS